MDYEKKKHLLVNLLYAGSILLLVFVAVRYGLSLVMPFLLAFLIAAALQTPTRWIVQHSHLPRRPVAMGLALLFYSTIGLVLSLLGIKLFSSIISLTANLPAFYTNSIAPALAALFHLMDQLFLEMDAGLAATLNQLSTQFVQSVGELVSSLSVRMVGTLSGYASSLPGLFIKTLLMMISTFFIAGDYDLLTSFVSRQFSDHTRTLLLEIKSYVVGTLFVCIRSYLLIMGITCVELSIGLSILRIPGAIGIAMLISVFDILPLLGTGGVMIPWVILAAVHGNRTLALGLLVVYLVITVIRNILEPKIVGSQLGLHPIVTLLCMFVGAQLLGIVGLFGFPILLSLLCHLNSTGAIHLFR